MKITETNAETGTTVERDATAEEIAQFEADLELNAIEEAAKNELAAARAALLERLGITPIEAKLLF